MAHASRPVRAALRVLRCAVLLTITAWLAAGLPHRALAATATTSVTRPIRATSARIAATVPGAPRFTNYVSPNGVGESAGEPSIGSNWTTEQAFANSAGPIPNGGSVNYFGGFLPYMLKITFDDCRSPALVTWDQKPLLTANTPREFGDPILYTDHATGRTFVSQLEGLTPAGSTTDITDNDGNSFSPSQGGGTPACVDHQTFGGGPFHAPLTGTVYPDAVYYASQCVADATIALSVDGGLTFGPSFPMFTVNDCDGLHGHVKVAPDGTVYVPDKACGGTVPLLNGGDAAAVVSEDNGATWTIRPIPDGASMGEWDPSIGIATDGTVYLGYQGADGHPRIAVSHDKGAHWSASVDVGAASASVVTDTPEGIHNTAFPAVVAGDPDRAAFAFYGTTTADGPGEDHTGGANDDPTAFTGVWYLYIATTYDGGRTWSTQNVTPGDPIQRGPICGGGNCRNMLDFFDATIDKEGRVLVGWDDGCVDGCVTALPNSNSAKATITRQSGGRRMYAAFDPVEPHAPEAAGLSGEIVDGTVHLSWQAPDNGGADITGYKVYRKTGANPFALLGTVAGTTFTDTVDPQLVNTYRVTAVNAQGEGPYCSDFTPVAGTGATACVAPGLDVVTDVNPDGTDNDSGQNTPADGSVNVRDLAMAEPYAGPGVSQVTFTVQLQPSTTGGAPSSSQWYVVWNRTAPASDGSDRRFVAMKTDATGAESFVYGNFGPPLPLDGSPPPSNANTPTPLGDADGGHYDPASGLLTITLATAKLDDAVLGPGSTLSGVNVRTFLAAPDAGPKSQSVASDITNNGNYTLVGNGACFCAVDHKPIAGLAASPGSGAAPLTVQFDASSSVDPDVADGDAVASYTFDFGDGTPAVTQSSARVAHTYTQPSGGSPFIATLTVTDAKCGRTSANIASADVDVSGAAGVSDPEEQHPRVFRITPAINPSHGLTPLTLDLPRDGLVSVQMFGADGRRVAEVVNAWLPAGTHFLKWSATDRAGRPLPAGIYLVRARWADRVALSRVALVP